MNSKQFLESTTSGSVATVATPVGKTQTRGKGIYPNEKGGNLLTGKKTNKKYANSNPMKEAKLDEEDVIIVPGQGNRIKPGFIPRKADRTDHEVEMALSDLFQSAKNAKQVYELIKDIPETVGIEGWVQEKIIKANDYLNTVREYLEHKQLSEDTIQGKRDNFTVDDIKALEKIRDLETIKARAKELIKGFPDRRMKPEKIDYFYNRINSLFSPMQVIKLMYDLLLAGEGMKTIGSRYSTSANSYQRRFDEMTAGVIAGGGVGEGVAEGIVGKVLGGAALIASLWGIGQNQAQQVYDNSPQLQTLIKYHQMATQQGDQAKIQELERRIENHKTRLSVGKGEVMGSDNKPIVPSFESSIMKGIQNEQSSDKRDFKRREMEHELGHETNNHAVMIDGKIWKVFADKRQAENIARSLRNKGKKASVGLTGASVSESQIPDKCPDCGGKLVAESELNEEGNKDACYHKVKSRYKVWPSAYASGALVKCRKVGASNWGNKSK